MNAIIFGATGMVGIEVLHACFDDDRIDSVVAVSRSSTGVNHPKLREIQHRDFKDLSSLENELAGADICFYCIGVYQGKVSTEMFWEITVDYISALIATLERVHPDITFCLFSAMGADPSEKRSVLFAKAKGRAERLLMESGISNHYIFRPGHIKPGRRTANSRIPLWLGNIGYALFPSIGIDAVDLARVMIHVGLVGNEKRMFENKDLRHVAKEIRSA
jgi:uncharacterized protein YbjT (DUF2867 family)